MKWDERERERERERQRAREREKSWHNIQYMAYKPVMNGVFIFQKRHCRHCPLLPDEMVKEGVPRLELIVL
jgi:hypothetical protein